MFKRKQRLRILDEGWDRITDLFLEQQKEISALQDTSIKVGDKVFLKKDMTKVYEVESISKGDDEWLTESDRRTLMLYGSCVRKIKTTKYSLSNNRVYTEDQILPYREDSHLLALKIKKLKK